jgi:uncharacterized repeat protein (TIGR01451 family)
MAWNLTPRFSPSLGRAVLAASVLAASVGVVAPTVRAQTAGADLSLTISASKPKIALGDTLDYTYTMRNSGGVALSGVLMRGSISGAASLSLLAPQQPVGQPAPCTLAGVDLSCPDLILGLNDTAVIKIRATASSSTPGEISASGAMDPDNLIAEANEVNNFATSKVAVDRLPDLVADILDGPNVVEGGARVTFKVRVRNLGGKADNAALDFRSSAPMDYESVTFVDNVKRGFICDMKEPIFGQNFVTCTGGDFGERDAETGEADSVTVLIGARVKARAPFSTKSREATVEVDPANAIRESAETNNSDSHAFQYD